jgi:hypothetical protein
MHEYAFYREPLLIALYRLGGSATRQGALAAMEAMLGDQLQPDDRIPQADRGAEEGWKNRTSWVVKFLKEEGLLLPTSVAGRGIWALSPDATEAARTLLNDDHAGIDYETPPRPSPPAPRQPFDTDPDLVDRGTQAHYDTVEALARWIRGQDLQPKLPSRTTPQYDLAWRHGEVFNVAEVKSITEENEERQLRLGLGQVLRYRHLVASGGVTVVAWLVCEREPSDTTWVTLCESIGVRLAWPSLLHAATIYA